MKNISILGSTGSIGTQTLDVVRHNNELCVTALAAGSNIKALAEQIREFCPKLVCVAKEESIPELRLLTNDLDYEVCYGMEGLCRVASMEETDTVVTAIVGMLGIIPTIEAIKTGHNIALANKETLVTAGHIIMPMAKEKNVSILPVDSEHSAIFQSLNGENPKRIEKILLTASGGPFRGRDIEYMKNVRPEDALKHPNWTMGRKITIDSSTMVNKGLEVIEAKWLFGVDIDDITVVVQPQSVIHSMVQFVDGSVIAQLGCPDMRLPIQYALFYPDRRVMQGERLDFAKLGSITFEAPDMKNFRGLALAYEAGRKGGNFPTVFNAANEYAVAEFLNHKIGYLDIIEMIERCMNSIQYIDNPDVSQILDTEQAVYELLRC
ncbi:MAG: 1-deoxy-D-xylulose-5-phosphate reductoisomerase [Butyrivibrio sp.]